MGFPSYQRLGFLLVFVIVQLIPSQDEPATVPRFDESPLLPEPAAPDDARASLGLGAAVGGALLVHHGSSDLGGGKKKQAELVGICGGKRRLSVEMQMQMQKTQKGAEFFTSVFFVQIPASYRDPRCRYEAAAVTFQRSVGGPAQREEQMLLPASAAGGLGCGDVYKTHAPQIRLPRMYVRMFPTRFPRERWPVLSCFG